MVQQDCPLHPEGQHEEVEGHTAPAVSPKGRGQEAEAQGCHEGQIPEDLIARHEPVIHLGCVVGDEKTEEETKSCL